MSLNIRLKTKNREYSLRKNNLFWACVFLAPLVTGLILFLLVPLGYAIYLSFNKYNLFVTEFVGFDNFKRLFTVDTQFLPSIKNAFIYALFVPITMVIAMFFANFFASRFAGDGFYKMVFFLPTICSAVAITFIWKWLYNTEYGPIGLMLRAIGFKKINFLDNKHAMGSMIAMSVWSGFGTSFLLYVAAIKSVPTSCLEAAQIDGANEFVRFYKIIFPMISPISFYIFITGIIGALQGFAVFFSMTGGVSPESVVMPVTIIYMYAGHGWGLEFGYASALAIVLGLIVGTLTIINFVVSKYWVYNND